MPLPSAKLCAFVVAFTTTGAPVASTAAKLVLQTLSVTEKRPYMFGYIADRIGPLPRPQWALCIWSLSVVQPNARSLFKASSDCAAVSAPFTRPLAARPAQRAAARTPSALPGVTRLKVEASAITAGAASSAQGWYRLP